jgi:hypothetical protein
LEVGIVKADTMLWCGGQRARMRLIAYRTHLHGRASNSTTVSTPAATLDSERECMCLHKHWSFNYRGRSSHRRSRVCMLQYAAYEMAHPINLSGPLRLFDREDRKCLYGYSFTGVVILDCNPSASTGNLEFGCGVSHSLEPGEHLSLAPKV